MKKNKKNKIDYCECQEETNIVYDEKYDSYYCTKCWKWIDKLLPDEICVLCSRPLRPTYKKKNDKSTDDAVEILHRRYVKDDPEILAELEKIRTEFKRVLEDDAELMRKLTDYDCGGEEYKKPRT